MYDFVSLGSATQDVILNCKKLDEITVSHHGLKEKKECFNIGTKIDIENINFSVGGGATNTAYVFKSFGFKTSIISKIGDDVPGKYVLDFLKKNKIDRKYIVTDNVLGTAYSTVMLSETGDRTAFIYRGVSRDFKLKDIPIRKIDANWLYITSIGGDINIIETVINIAKRKGIKVAFNPGNDELSYGMKALLPLFRNIDVLILNKREASMLSKTPDTDIKILFEEIMLATAGYVVITDGRKGAYAVYSVDRFDSSVYFVPSLSTKTIDTTGAGDTFGASFVAGLYRENMDIECALKVASLNSASVVGEVGAKNGVLKRFPPKLELDKIKIEKINLSQ